MREVRCASASKHRTKYEPVLATDLARGSRMCAHLRAEMVDFLHNELFHALDRIFVLKPKVKLLYIMSAMWITKTKRI